MSDDLGFSNMDPSIWRGLTQRRLSRRDLLRYAGVGAGAMGLSAFLAACGTKGSVAASGAAMPNANVGTASWWGKQTQHNVLNFANWPYYIDVSHGQHPTLEQFTKQTGIKVNYFEVIQDNTSFYKKIQPSLQAGQYTGYDIVVLTNNSPILSEIFNAGFVIPLDHAKMPNFEQYAGPLVKNPTWDPGNKYSMAWQSGWTALAYNTDHIKTPITSVQSLFDPAYKGKVGMMSDPQELGTVGLLATGVEPAKSTPADWKNAATKLGQQKSAGIVRNYYDQSYIQALKNGDTWISMAWSGDIYQAQLSGFTNLKMVMPQEGAGFWTDNMMIPLYAQNPMDAMTYMDSVYSPAVQALIEAYDDYVCPVPAAQALMAKSSNSAIRAASKAPTVFPTPEYVALSRPYYSYKNSNEILEWNNIFLPIVQG